MLQRVTVVPETYLDESLELGSLHFPHQLLPMLFFPYLPFWIITLITQSHKRELCWAE